MGISERIDLLLAEKKMSRRKLAIMAGIPPSSLQSAMQRKGSMTVNMVEKLAETLECSPAWICGWSERRETE